MTQAAALSRNPAPHHAPRLFGLDAVRALAILGVLFYHLNRPGFFNAGFLGVDVFFNLSGFLITALLLRDFEGQGGAGIGGFYARRIKRLFPASLVMVLACVALAPVLAPESYDRLCKDLPAAFLYVSNWWQIFSQQSYFETFGHPPLLQHLWSLAVEEQFYLVWPATLLIVLRSVGRRATGLVCLALALAGTAWMAHVYEAHASSGDPSRAYLGSDTHSMGLFLGAALACFWSPWHERSPALVAWVGRWRWLLASLAVGALGYMLTAWHEGLPLLFYGGFLGAGVATLLLIVALTDLRVRADGDSFPAAAALACLRWLGERSYSIYLWHWPIFVVLSMGPDTTWETMALGFVLTAVVAEASWQLVEKPCQRLQWKKLASTHPWGLTAATLGALALVSVLLKEPLQVARHALWPATPVQAVVAEPVLARSHGQAAQQATVLPHEAPKALPTPPALADGPLVLPDLAATDAPAATLQAPGQPLAQTPLAGDGVAASADPQAAAPQAKKIIAVGDSVLLGASDSLSRRLPEVAVDAVKGRQANQGLSAIQKLRQDNAEADYAVIHLGTNGFIVESQFTQLLAALADLRHVTVINVHANRRWMEPNNELIARVTAKFPNVRVVDWHGIGKDNPQYFAADGIHLSGEGIMALVKEISKDTGVPLHQLATARKPAEDANSAKPRPSAGGSGSGVSVVSAPRDAPGLGARNSFASEKQDDQ